MGHSQYLSAMVTGGVEQRNSKHRLPWRGSWLHKLPREEMTISLQRGDRPGNFPREGGTCAKGVAVMSSLEHRVPSWTKAESGLVHLNELTVL